LVIRWLALIKSRGASGFNPNGVVLTGSRTSVSAGGKTMANLEVAVFETIEAFSDLPTSITPIIKARRDAIAKARVSVLVKYGLVPICGHP